MAVAKTKPAKPDAKPEAKAAAPASKSQSAPAVAQFSKGQELHAYREMLLIRRFEEKAGQMYGMGLIGGFCHLYIGQEASSSACRSALRRATPSSPATATTATCWPAAWTRKA